MKMIKIFQISILFCVHIIYSQNTNDGVGCVPYFTNLSGWDFYLKEGFVSQNNDISSQSGVYQTSSAPSTYNEHPNWIRLGSANTQVDNDFSMIRYDVYDVNSLGDPYFYVQGNIDDYSNYSVLSKKTFQVNQYYGYNFSGFVFFKRNGNSIGLPPISESTNNSYFKLKRTISYGNNTFTDEIIIKPNSDEVLNNNNSIYNKIEIVKAEENYLVFSFFSSINLDFEHPNIFCYTDATITYELITAEESTINENIDVSLSFNYAHTDIDCYYLLSGEEAKFPCTNFVHPLTNISGGSYTIKLVESPFTVYELGNNYSFVFPQPGRYKIYYTYTNPQLECEITRFQTVNVTECESRCQYCTSFELEENKKYTISGWTSLRNNDEDLTEIPLITNFDNCKIIVEFLQNDTSLQITEFNVTGSLIDGWQKIKGDFIVPVGTTNMEITLLNNSTYSSLFDDIRVHPKDGTMKSFVYDAETKKLMAELDENNYATFYEYDKEGGLVRVKKETEKGIYTIQETRSNTVKKENND